MKLYHFLVIIEGIRPLLCNQFTDIAQLKASEGTSSSTVGDKGTPKEQADQRLYRGLGGELIIPQPNILRCIIDAGKFFKSGRSKITTQKSSLIPACVDVSGMRNPVEIDIVSKEGWSVDTRAVRIPATGGRILCHRPMFQDWRLSFRIELDSEIIGPKLLRQIVDAAGKRIGLGDFRPDCKGPFGKFVVVEWTVEAVDGEESEEAAA